MIKRLFVYGSLTDPEVQQLFIGRIIKGIPCSVAGYKLTETGYGKRTFPALIHEPHNSQKINGLVLDLTDTELLAIDQNQGQPYKRVKTVLSDKSTAWIYIAK